MVPFWNRSEVYTLATLTVKNIPDNLYGRLREMAALHRRSINSQIIVCIERAVQVSRIPAGEVLTRARNLRRRMAGPPLTVAELLEDKSQGRT